jgi:hypothetical protein
MASIPSTLLSSVSTQKEPRYVYLSESKASHSHRTWTEVSSSVAHFLQIWLLLSPIICRCLLKVLCPVSRSITILACVLLKDSNRAPVARLGPEIYSLACLCVLQGPLCGRKNKVNEKSWWPHRESNPRSASTNCDTAYPHYDVWRCFWIKSRKNIFTLHSFNKRVVMRAM